MDYTTSTRVKLEAGIQETTDDVLIASLITSASRWLDRELTGHAVGSDNYLLSETITGETLYGQIDKDGNIAVWPHKPVVTVVTAMSWRPDPLSGYVGADVSRALWIDGYKVTAFYAALANRTRGKVQVLMTYAGGIAADVNSLPADILEDVAVMTIRIYRENKTGLTDAMGVAELGTATYTKAAPVRLLDWIKSYRRVVPW
jgi:hypothetical protein